MRWDAELDVVRVADGWAALQGGACCASWWKRNRNGARGAVPIGGRRGSGFGEHAVDDAHHAVGVLGDV